MAEGDGAIYNNFKEQVMLGAFNLSTNTINGILVSGYTPDIDADVNYASVSGDEYGTATGYTAGGETLTTKTVTQDDANDRAVWDADNVTWSSLGPLAPNTPSHFILYSTTATNQLIAYWEIGTTATNGGDYTMAFNAVGILTLT